MSVAEMLIASPKKSSKLESVIVVLSGSWATQAHVIGDAPPAQPNFSSIFFTIISGLFTFASQSVVHLELLCRRSCQGLGQK